MCCKHYGVRWRSSRNLLELAISPTDGIKVHLSIVTTKTADFSKKSQNVLCNKVSKNFYNVLKIF